MHHALRAKTINFPISNRRSRTWPIVEMNWVNEFCWVGKFPKSLARFRTEALDDFLSTNAMKNNHFAPSDDRITETLARFLLPNDGRPLTAPMVGQSGS